MHTEKRKFLYLHSENLALRSIYTKRKQEFFFGVDRRMVLWVSTVPIAFILRIELRSEITCNVRSKLCAASRYNSLSNKILYIFNVTEHEYYNIKVICYFHENERFIV